MKTLCIAIMTILALSSCTPHPVPVIDVDTGEVLYVKDMVYTDSDTIVCYTLHKEQLMSEYAYFWGVYVGSLPTKTDYNITTSGLKERRYRKCIRVKEKRRQ